MADYAALKLEIAKPEYIGLTDEEIIAALNAAIPVMTDVPTSTVRGVLLAAPTGDWGKLVGAADGWIPVSTDQRVFAVTARDTLIQTEIMMVSDSDKWIAMQTVIGGLVSAGIIAQDTANSLFALAHTTRPGYFNHGFFREIDIGDIIQARLA